MIQARFSGEKVVSNSSMAFGLYERSSFGEKVFGRVEYGFFEALFLVSIGKMRVFAGKNELGFDALVKKMKRRDGKIQTKLAVFSDLRRKGYIVKTALKFGADFRVYEKGIKPGKDHARWILYVVKENDVLKWHEFTAKNRVAHSTKKNLLLGVVDDEGDVIYYVCQWFKP